MRRLNQHRISVELYDIARRIIRQRRIKCDTSNKISLDVTFPSNKIGRIKCAKPCLTLAHFFRRFVSQ